MKKDGNSAESCVGGKKDEYPDVIHEYWSKVLLQLLV